MSLPITYPEIEAVLRRHVLDAWYPRGIDEEHGGFLCDFDRRWEPCGPHEKLTEFQSRQTWLAADASIRYPDDPVLRRAALHGYAYLSGPAWDEAHGGWYHRLDRTLTPLQNHTKHLHGFAYALLACLAVEEMSGDPAALDLAREGFEWVYAHARDPDHGAFFGFFGRDGTTIRERCETWDRDLDAIGTPLGLKDVNVNSDFLEALIRLYDRWPDPRVAASIGEVVALLCDKLTRPDGALYYFANADGSPHSDHIRYGHILQNSYRAMHARDRLGQRERGIDEACRAVRFALRHGRDDGRGFLHSNTSVPGAPARQSKQWWIQAEGLRALFEVLAVRPEDAELVDGLSSHWRFVRECCVDERYGGFFMEAVEGRRGLRGLFGSGRVSKHTVRKGSCWKYAGHEGHALLCGLDVHDVAAV